MRDATYTTAQGKCIATSCAVVHLLKVLHRYSYNKCMHASNIAVMDQPDNHNPTAGLTSSSTISSSALTLCSISAATTWQCIISRVTAAQKAEQRAVAEVTIIEDVFSTLVSEQRQPQLAAAVFRSARCVGQAQSRYQEAEQQCCDLTQ